MTLNANDARNEYTASAGQTVFNYTFKIYASTDLNVYVTPDGQECSSSDLTESYTVSGVGLEDGGSITLNTPTVANDLVTIVSAIPSDRTTDYQNNGDFRPDTVNDDFDRTVSLVKQALSAANRSLQFPECQQSVSALTLPSPEALRFVRWKSDLSGMENTDAPSVSVTTVTTVSVNNYNGLRSLTGQPVDQVISVAYRANENDGGGGQFRWDDSDLSTEVTADSLSGIYVAPSSDLTGATGAWVRIVEYDHYNILWFGATRDISADNYAVIEPADQLAASAGVPLFFPEGIYGVEVVQNPATINATTSWYSEGEGVWLTNTNLGLTDDTVFVQVDGQSELTFDRIHLDGQITTTGSGVPNQDQASPSDSNINDYTRCVGWQVKGGENIILRNCKTRNLFRASFRADSDAKGILFENCQTNRNRGTFGDPFYCQNVRNTQRVNCRAYDYTRIGFVYEGTAAQDTASDFVADRGCYAEYAHDNFSGENSCGYWVENTQEYVNDGCFAVNTVGGMVLTSTDSSGATIANGGVLSNLRTYNVTNFTALSVKAGININPDDEQGVFNLTNCNCHLHSIQDVANLNGTATQFSTRDVISAQLGDVFCEINIVNCGGYIPNDNYVAAEGYGFFGLLQNNDNTVRKVITMKNCALEFTDPAKVRTDALTGGGGKGFFHSNGSTGVELHLDNCQEMDTTDNALSISVTSYDDKNDIYITNCRPQIIRWSGRANYIEFKDCDYVDCDVNGQVNTVRLSNSQYNVLNWTTNDWKMYNCVGSQLVMTTVDPHTRYDGFTAVGCNINGNLSSGDSCIFTVTDSREWRAVFQNCTFHDANKGAATSFHFITIDTGFGYIAGSGNLIDDNITNYMERNGSNFSNPKTDVDADMPFGIFQALDA